MEVEKEASGDQINREDSKGKLVASTSMQVNASASALNVSSAPSGSKTVAKRTDDRKEKEKEKTP